MQVATTGLVLRQVKVGEADRILTILTPDLGVVSASARGSLRMKSALFSATGLFLLLGIHAHQRAQPLFCGHCAGQKGVPRHLCVH